MCVFLELKKKTVKVKRHRIKCRCYLNGESSSSRSGCSEHGSLTLVMLQWWPGKKTLSAACRTNWNLRDKDFFKLFYFQLWAVSLQLSTLIRVVTHLSRLQLPADWLEAEPLTAPPPADGLYRCSHSEHRLQPGPPPSFPYAQMHSQHLNIIAL